MARSYGEGFHKPVDIFTGQPIPGAPLVGQVSSNPYNRGRVILEPLPGEKIEPSRPPIERAANPIVSQPKMVYDYDGDGM